MQNAILLRRTIDLPRKAVEFPADSVWLNIDKPLAIKDLRGQIVVLDFWTYCCINCIHTIPDLEWIENKYSDQPVVIIGVHSAKYQNEQDPENIREAIGRYEVGHPVVVDADMRIWRSYGVSGWPTIMVIDPKGNIVYHQSGEGQRDNIDDVIGVILERSRQQGVLAKSPIPLTRPSSAKRTLSYPGKLSLSTDGKAIAICDSNHNRILIVDTGSGRISAKIGNGTRGLCDGGYSDAMFYRPQGVAWVQDEIYVADTENHALRVINLRHKVVRTLAGNGRQGRWISTFQQGKDAQLNSPWDVTHDNGFLFIAMAGLHQIWAYEISSGRIGPLAGSGYEGIVGGAIEQAQFAQPSGLSICGDSLYVADSEVSAVRRVDLRQRTVETIAGAGLFVFGHNDGPLGSALMQHPLGVTCSREMIYIADTYNHAVRRIDKEQKVITTIVGKADSKTMCNFDDPTCDSLGLYEPSDVKLRGATLFISDTNNHLIRTFDLKSGILRTLPVSE